MVLFRLYLCIMIIGTLHVHMDACDEIIPSIIQQPTEYLNTALEPSVNNKIGRITSDLCFLTEKQYTVPKLYCQCTQADTHMWYTYDPDNTCATVYIHPTSRMMLSHIASYLAIHHIHTYIQEPIHPENRKIAFQHKDRRIRYWRANNIRRYLEEKSCYNTICNLDKHQETCNWNQFPNFTFHALHTLQAHTSHPAMYTPLITSYKEACENTISPTYLQKTMNTYHKLRHSCG